MEHIRIEHPFSPDRTLLLEAAHLTDDADATGDFLELVDLAENIASSSPPRAAATRARVEYTGGGGGVIISSVSFRSTLLASNVMGLEWVYPYLATCGAGLWEATHSIQGTLRQFWWDGIVIAALQSAAAALKREVEDHYGENSLGFMSPGSLSAWPITQQKPLFQLLGSDAVWCGVELTEDLLMLPAKSLSGIWFDSPGAWSNCEHCDKTRCPTRRDCPRGK